MKKALLPLIFAVLAACLPACRKEADFPAAGEQAAQLPEDGWQPGVAAVRFSEELLSLIGPELGSGCLPTRSEALQTLSGRLGIKSFRRVFEDDERFLGRQRREGLHRWYYVEFDPQAMPATKAADEMAALPGVEDATLLYRVRNTAAFFDDEYYSLQWHLHNESGPDINVEPVWRNYTTGDPGVVIGVVDGGVDFSHEDLQDNCLPGGPGKSGNFVSGGYTIKPTMHGTHVAGIIAATSGNGIGVAGIAGGNAARGLPGVTILSCQVFEEDGDGNEVSGNFADAIRYAADNGAVICQNSWGYILDVDGDGTISADELERAAGLQVDAVHKTAIDYFIKYAGCDDDGEQLPGSPMKGGIVIFAAGNDNIPYGAPATYEPVLAVASIAQSGFKSDFSNYGDWVDICAPGSGIASTVPMDASGSPYKYASGTSMATPMVSAVAGLVLSQRGGPGFTPAMLRDCLVGGASADKVRSPMIGPLVDALGAVSYGLDSRPGAVRDFDVSVLSNKLTVSWPVPADADGKPAYGALVCVSADRAALEQAEDPASLPADVIRTTVVTSGFRVGDRAEATVTDLAFEKDYYVAVVPFGYGNSYAPFSAVKGVRTDANRPPVIVPDAAVSGLVLHGTERISIRLAVSDPDGHAFRVEWEGSGCAGESWTQRSAGEYILTIDGVRSAPGGYEALVRATDSYGAESTLRIDYRILANRPPEVRAAIPDLLLEPDGNARSFVLADYFSDPDADELSYVVRSDNPGIPAGVSGGVMTLTPTAPGLAEISVSALDPRGDSASQSFKVAVRAASEAISVYPTQVSGSLYVGTGEQPGEISVRVVSLGSGAVVIDAVAVASVFEPAGFDLSSLAPGRYSVVVAFGGQTYTRTVVKI